jgi:hypothetical protein
MGEQQGTSRLSVLLTGLAFILSCTVFGAAFHYLDGMALVTDLLARTTSLIPATESQSSVPIRPSDEVGLPQGVPEEFALALMQEQIDSQEMIGRLVEGGIASFSVERVERADDEATLTVRVNLVEGESVDGAIGLKRFEDRWYVSYASRDRGGAFSRPTQGDLTMDDLDRGLVSAIFTEQATYEGVLNEYVEGIVDYVTLGRPIKGPNTVTLDAVMYEKHGTAQASIVAIRHELDGRPYWFLARFMKIRHDPPEL